MCPRARHILFYCENVAMLPRGTIRSQVAHLTVQAFVISGSDALRPIPHNLP